KDVTTTIAVQASGVEVPTGPRGVFALDLNLDYGDDSQAQTSSVPSVGDTVTIDLVATEGASGAVGFSATLSYNTDALKFLSLSAVDLFANGMPIPQLGEGTVSLNVALLGTSSTKDSGSMGQVQFEVRSGFSEKTTVVLLSGQYGTSSGTSDVTIGSGGASAVIGGGTSSGEPTADFSGDGKVDFSDFVQFAQAFGGTNPAFDLDGDGKVGFGDFVKFAQAFGSTVGKPAGLAKPVGVAPGPNGDAGVTVSSRSAGADGEVSVVVGVSDAVEVSGYSLRVSYDASALELLGSEAVAASRFGDSGSVGLSTRPGVGEAVIADMLVSDAVVSGSGDLVRLRFRVLDATVSSRVSITDVEVSDGLGRIDLLAGVEDASVRAIPAEYALGQNYPNPFNPDTQISYQLPESGEVWLVVYNLLGQEVRVLAQGHQDVGYYRVVWDGKDTSGRSVSSGVYLVRMASGDFTSVKKMLLLK
ncbi:MAG: cohesin domain-containing protein, partial [Candidatus Latescibacteria bacterium]|nr:cohesin domain-containing protein [Candidatus Latescibacterota bacterium]